MTEVVFLRLGQTADNVYWCVCLAEGGVAAHQGTLSDAVAALSGRRVTVLVPGTGVLLAQTMVPVRQRQRLLQALPYVLEEQLAGDVESMHFAAGPRGKDGMVAVAAVNKDLMEQWLQALQGAGVQVHAMIPETLVLPYSPGEWSIVCSGATTWLRQGRMQAHVLETGQTAELLELALHNAGEAPSRIRIYRDVSVKEELLTHIGHVCEQAGVGCEQEEYTDLLHLFANGFRTQQPELDLLQGRYSRHEHVGKLWRPWRAAAVLALLVAVIQGLHAGAHYRQLQREDAQLAQQIEQLYRQTFPDARKVVNPRVQMEQRLRALKQGARGQELIRLLSAAGAALRQQAGVEFRALHYHSGELEFVLYTPDLQALDKLKQDLLATGALAVEITSANSTGNRVEGRMQIRSATP